MYNFHFLIVKLHEILVKKKDLSEEIPADREGIKGLLGVEASRGTDVVGKNLVSSEVWMTGRQTMMA
jgi:hypothetical protein